MECYRIKSISFTQEIKLISKFPNHYFSQKLRRVLRKAFTISENIFKYEELVSQLIPLVIDTIGMAYPELYNKQSSILELIAHEREIFKALRESSSRAFAEILVKYPNLEEVDLMECPGFVSAYRDFQIQRETFNNNILPGKFLFKLTDTYGLTEENFKRLAELENMECDFNGYLKEIAKAKLRSKAYLNDGGSENKLENQHQINEALLLLTQKLNYTDNSTKYNYSYDIDKKRYNIPCVSARVTGMVFQGKESNTVLLNNSQSELLYVATDITNFYHESGGQQADIGTMLLTSETNGEILELPVREVKAMNDCIIHVCDLSNVEKDFILKTDAHIKLLVDANRRQLTTCHHTGM